MSPTQVREPRSFLSRVIALPLHLSVMPDCPMFRIADVIQAVALPTGSLQSSNFAGQWARAAGYGKTSDGKFLMILLFSWRLTPRKFIIK